MNMMVMGKLMAMMMMVMGMELAARCVLPTQEATVHWVECRSPTLTAVCKLQQNWSQSNCSAMWWYIVQNYALNCNAMQHTTMQGRTMFAVCIEQCNELRCNMHNALGSARLHCSIVNCNDLQWITMCFEQLAVYIEKSTLVWITRFSTAYILHASPTLQFPYWAA